MKTLTPAKIEKIWNILERLKETAEEEQKKAQKEGGKALETYSAGVKKGIQYALNWIDYYLKH